MRDKALSLAARGYAVFPLETMGNVPIKKNFFLDATTDAAKVRALWTNALGDPADYNIGILTGKGIVGVDYDVKNGASGLIARAEHEKKGIGRAARVSTPSGGEHLILRLPEKLVVGSTVRKLHPGVDTRGRNSYLVGPGSVREVDGESREYTWKEDVPADETARVPDWLLDDLLRLGRYSDSPGTASPLCDLDTPDIIVRATAYLKDAAPHANEGEGGDHTTYKVAAHLRDIGVSEDFALDLMAEHWNETKANPPWGLDELKRKVANAFRYATGAPGGYSAAADFEAVEIDETARGVANTLKSDPDFPKPDPLGPIDLALIEPRRFLFRGNQIARKTVTALVAPSGAGKTQLTIQLALALAANTPSSGFTPVEKTNVWLWNQEDDHDELSRRFAAALQSHGVPHPSGLFFNSGVHQRLTLVKRDDKGDLRATKYVERIIARMKEHNIRLLVLDPLVEFHEAEENDNVQMAYVAGVLRRIAVKTDAAVLIGHHDRKPDSASSTGHAGNQNAMRGASALQGVTRAIYTLYQMSEADAREHGVKPEHRHRFLRLDTAKTNLALAGGEPHWLERRGERLLFGAGEDAERQEVGVLAPVELARASAMSAQDAVDICAKATAELASVDGAWVDWSLVVALMTNKQWGAPSWRRPARSWQAWLDDLIDSKRDGAGPAGEGPAGAGSRGRFVRLEGKLAALEIDTAYSRGKARCRAVRGQQERVEAMLA